MSFPRVCTPLRSLLICPHFRVPSKRPKISITPSSQRLRSTYMLRSPWGVGRMQRKLALVGPEIMRAKTKASLRLAVESGRIAAAELISPHVVLAWDM